MSEESHRDRVMTIARALVVFFLSSAQVWPQRAVYYIIIEAGRPTHTRPLACACPRATGWCPGDNSDSWSFG
jgi:hypothetical protein